MQFVTVHILYVISVDKTLLSHDITVLYLFFFLMSVLTDDGIYILGTPQISYHGSPAYIATPAKCGM